MITVDVRCWGVHPQSGADDQASGERRRLVIDWTAQLFIDWTARL